MPEVSPLSRRALILSSMAVGAAVAAALVYSGVGISWAPRTAVVGALVLTAPGMAVLVWSNLQGRLLRLLSAVVVSACMVTVIAQAAVSLKWWHPEALVTALLLASAVSLLTAAFLPVRTAPSSASSASSGVA